MQSCRRGSGRAFCFSIDGLIPILFFKAFFNVRRQRHVSDGIKHSIDITVFFRIVFKAHDAISLLTQCDHLSPKDTAEIETRAHLGAFSGAHQRFPCTILQHFEQQKLHGSSRFFGYAEKARRDDLRGIDDENIPLV